MRAELFSMFVINENFKFLTYPQQTSLKIDREKCGYRMINQVKDNKDSLAHHIKAFHSLKSILHLKKKVLARLTQAPQHLHQADFG